MRWNSSIDGTADIHRISSGSIHVRRCWKLVHLVCLLICLVDSTLFASAFGGKLWRLVTRKRNGSAAESGQTFQQTLLTRRTINNFEETLPKDWEETLQQAIHVATYAPNHKRTEPWRFHLLGPESIQKVCKLNAKLVSAKKGPQAGEKKLKRWMAIPGWLVVTCRKDDSSNDSHSMLDPMSIAREDYAACCCAIQNFCLSLHANGMGTKWTTGPVNFDPGFSDAVGFSSTEEYVVGTIWFGIPASQPSAPSKKLDLDDVLIRHD
ncbi:nitroreductase [Nitzschia inconspicua]|uniref:Nitroreductase n=1 Tax=Nitzschia inconspicua TaxID=303405 RepID=A0A9K3K6W4_9STRA|nr:nitroreductase [Nitzschia inconspicua]KAG7372408.1 nitroreductase [Nitzschia inconspicua]